ncbi:NhaP-type Na+/H+ or K+/H+ antiporter [Actinoplanes lutulentus]|uniref:Sodium/proton antiporter (CPA1 family) n=1 Tax=Actinoplanes lutulentus TaxID=1287878 RepID=A0A327Z2U1_9ACTN|nr:cation:proton antiporter [Actinoplanes lutulentus]MBB2946614.1 NhaP-type Na+/H+ or K+/H+ antiporter [Actinoplanes lutulentus]RAK26532.1 sodium/proton antiporter (CPA1 family) [Actinoplanes lutulentus]
MEAAAVSLVMVAIFCWGLTANRLGRADLSAPIVFVLVGVLFSEGVRAVEPEATQEVVKLLAEVTLVWVLFADASRVGPREVRADLGLYVRLLGIGLPLTIAAGSVLAVLLFDGLGFWLALLVGAALAPTDAALGAAVMANPAVPERIRRVLNVESGLNDGIATPVVTIAVAGAVTAETFQGALSLGGALLDLAVGLGVGVLAGLAGGHSMRIARHRGWAAEDFAGPAVLALALAAYASTVALGGNGFVSAFVAGLAFGHYAGRGGVKEVFYVEQTAGLVSLLTWLAFGAVAVPIVIDHAGWRVVAYAVLSLTVVRMLPVGLVLIRSGLSLPTISFIGWFGPRGLASIIFALIAVEELHDAAGPAVAVIGMTVLLSVFAHGLSAKPLANRYARQNGAGMDRGARAGS